MKVGGNLGATRLMWRRQTMWVGLGLGLRARPSERAEAQDRRGECDLENRDADGRSTFGVRGVRARGVRTWYLGAPETCHGPPLPNMCTTHSPWQASSSLSPR